MKGAWFVQALEYLSRAVAVAPNYAEILDHFSAIAGKEMFCSRAAFEAEAYNNLGWLFWDHGDLAQACKLTAQPCTIHALRLMVRVCVSRHELFEREFERILNSPAVS